MDETPDYRRSETVEENEDLMPEYGTYSYIVYIYIVLM